MTVSRQWASPEQLLEIDQIDARIATRIN